MTKYSCYEHSQSTEMPTFIPEYAELKDDISKLKTGVSNLKQDVPRINNSLRRSTNILI